MDVRPTPAAGSPRLAFLGAGAWGTALAQHAASASVGGDGNGVPVQVRLWARDAALLQDIGARRRNDRYLPDVPLAATLGVEPALGALARWLGEAAPGEALCVVATSLAGLRPTLRAWLAAHEDAVTGAAPVRVAPIVWLCKGIEADTGLLPHQVVAQTLDAWSRPAEGGASARSGSAAIAGGTFPDLRSLPRGPLFGPSFAQEVARGLPAALTVANAGGQGLDRLVQRALHHGALRIYASDDVIGVELGGALKNVMAIATGLCDGLALGSNARAALITRGLAEIGRLGAAMGAQPQTFMGLTGLGDLVLTCTGDLSRNRRVGLMLAAGQTLDQILASLGHVAEGVACVDAARQLGRRHGVDLPIVEAVAAVLSGRLAPADVVQRLLSRQPKREAG